MKKVLLLTLYFCLSYLIFFYPTLNSNIILESGNDAKRFHYPVRSYLSEKLRAGEFPFWTERMLSGYPIYADAEAGYLNPLNVFLTFVFGPFTSYKVLHFLTYLAGSFGLIYFLKGKINSLTATLTTHFVYFFSFFSLYHQQHLAITFSFYLFPLLIHLLESYVSSKRTVCLYGYLFLTLHLLYLGAFQMCLIAALTSATYLIINKNTSRYVLKRSIVPLISFLLLLTPLIISYTKLYNGSQRSQNQDLWLQGSFSPQVALNLFYPFNYRGGSDYMGVIVDRGYLMHEVYFYMGVSTAILAVLGVVFSKLHSNTNKLLLLWIGLFLVLGFAKYNPLIIFIKLPLFSYFRYWGRTVFLLIFALSIYCGHFVDQITTKTEKFSWRLTNVRILIASIIYLLVLDLLRYPQLSVITLINLWKRADFVFDYALLVIVFLAATLLVLVSKFRRWVFIIPIIEVAVFGHLVLKGAFVATPNIDTDAQNTNQRVVDPNVIGNLTLYHKAWSPFGYVSLPNAEYEEIIKRVGFISSRGPFLAGNTVDNNLVSKELGVGISTMFYTDAKITPTYRSEQKHTIDVFAEKPVLVRSYLRYDSNWRVNANNLPVKTIKDGIFLSFVLPAGQTIVEFTYIPVSLYWSFLAALLGIVAINLLQKLLELGGCQNR